ncbi:MAG: AAA-type ATPase lid domain-containing protein, partial [Lysobacter sp.]
VALAGDALIALQHYAWPGNVRELGNLLERLAVLHPAGTVRAADLPARYRAAMPVGDLFETVPTTAPEAAHTTPSQGAFAGGLTSALTTPGGGNPAPPDPSQLSPYITLPAQGLDLRVHMAGIELELIRAALTQSGGVVAHAAPLLGLRRTTLVEKLRKHGIDRDQADGLGEHALGEHALGEHALEKPPAGF